MLTSTINASMAERSKETKFEQPNPAIMAQPLPPAELQPPLQPPLQSQPNQVLPTDCAVRPEKRSTTGKAKRSNLSNINAAMTVDRFRRSQGIEISNSNQFLMGGQSVSGYTPHEQIIPADPTNYGDRYLQDVNGNPVNFDPIIVLHETVGSAASTVGLFRTAHRRDEDQASYHTLITLDGTIVYLVPADKRAYGAGNSIFRSSRGVETVKTHAKFPPSVNNFAYHISLETPPSGYNNSPRHSGYTLEQYQSLAWLVAKTGVTDDRITTHQAVDRSGSRMDPRSFDGSYFLRLLQLYPRTNEIPLRCTIPAGFTFSQRP